jgi:hypothetical protein
MTGLESFVTGGSRQIRRRLSTLFLVLSLVFGLAQIYACRYQLNPDAMDYLDIARQLASGHWSAIANGYWGTMISVILAPMFAFHPSAAWELPLAHLHCVLILFGAFFSFRWFLHTCLDKCGAGDEEGKATSRPPEWALCLVGYGLFLWTSLEVVSLAVIGPDLLVAMFVYLASAALLRLQRETHLRSFLFFGLILGVGYWAKAIMFPIALAFLIASIIRAPSWKKNLASLVAFALAAAPLLLALSLPRGRFTFGDSGKLNYSSYVSPGGRVINWQGVPAASGIPKHPTRKIDAVLPIYEFNGPISGTYPPSYDPSYWDDGRRVTFDLHSQLDILAEHTPTVIELLLLAQPSLTAGFLFLVLWSPEGFWSNFRRYWYLPAISAIIIGLYMLVHFETRFGAAFVVLIWMPAFMSVRIPGDKSSQRMSGLSIAALVIVILLSVASDVAKQFIHQCGDSALGDVGVAEQLNLPPGTPVAVVGAGNFAYWAHLAQARIVAEIMETEEVAFWRLPAAQRQDLYAAFRTTGAEWLIAQPPPVLLESLDDGWQQIGTTVYYRYPLQKGR